jgi:hypothetical protein
MFLASSEAVTSREAEGTWMSDAIVEAFNNARTWDDVLTTIESNAATLLDVITHAPISH